jgi:hypothetical protein
MGFIVMLFLTSSHSSYIYAIIFLMGAYKPYENHTIVVLNGNDQSVIVAFDIEHHPVLSNEAGVPVSGLDVRRASPRGMPDITVPGLQRLTGICMLFPKLSQFLSGYDPHNFKYTTIPPWEQQEMLSPRKVL